MKLIRQQTRKLTVGHDLVGPNAQALLERIAEEPLRGVKRFVLSLRGVGAIDVAGVAVLVRLYSWAQSDGAAFEVVDVPESLGKELVKIGLQTAISFEGERPRTGDSIAICVLDARDGEAVEYPITPPSNMKVG